MWGGGGGGSGLWRGNEANDSGGDDRSRVLCGVRSYSIGVVVRNGRLGHPVKCPDVLVANPICWAKSVRKMTEMPKKSDLNLKARGLGTHGDSAF